MYCPDEKTRRHTYLIYFPFFFFPHLYSFDAMLFTYARTYKSTFDRQGFIVLEDVLTSAALDMLRAKVDAVLSELFQGCSKDSGNAAATPETMLHPEWIMSLHQVLPGGQTNWMWRLATEPKLLALLEHHLGPDIVLFSTQLARRKPK